MEKKIAIVILNWNGRPLLEQFLPSIVAYSKEATVYLGDNGSTDDSVDFVKRTYPSIRIIQNSENGGFTKGYNDVLKHIDAEVYCLLNNDVEVTENWLQPIITDFNNNVNTAIIQPKILDYKQKEFFDYAGAGGGFIDKYGYPYCRGRIFNAIEKDEGQYNDNSSIFWASGACLFIRKTVFDALNGFDESFFAHMEEIDLCWRAKNLGYTITYVGSSSVYHIGGATLKNTNPQKTYLNFRNSLYTLSKNSGGNLFFKILVRLILDGIAGIKFLVELKPLHLFAIVRAHLSYYEHLPKLLKQRSQFTKKSNYWHKKSIVLAHFVFGKRAFKSL